MYVYKSYEVGDGQGRMMPEVFRVGRSSDFAKLWLLCLKGTVEEMFSGHYSNSSFFWWDKFGGKKNKKTANQNLI